MKRYSWKASSDDGSYEVEPQKWFKTHKEAYEDMRNSALEKMKWNTEFDDFWDMDEQDYIGYKVEFHQNHIVHASYSGRYTYNIVEEDEKISKYGREWWILDSFKANEEIGDWMVAKFDEYGEVWMNNMDGYIVLIETSGRILKSDI